MEWKIRATIKAIKEDPKQLEILRQRVAEAQKRKTLKK